MTEEPQHEQVARWAVTTGRGQGGLLPAGQPPEPLLQLTDEQKASLGQALHDAQLSVLHAITRESAREDSYDGPRNVLRLTQALRGLGGLLGCRAGWFGYTPMDWDADDEDDFDEE